ncbi:MAG: AraC family ligand binding domain-containing protein [Candidatus Pristimantibacillus lignocellulolyticus]|uniref:AraC family ligand binding domain-containing protein n=1 Tax=Candidatus Pristimantibacillus lignocellulolyticus TaxID=2994561 RepID=A0A9J6ZAM0_9BACL|nr:MAG: AraC family ligand binding domain-containing protein [Candidatus Pristimantibacillus lignocellulolyticus]
METDTKYEDLIVKESEGEVIHRLHNEAAISYVSSGYKPCNMHQWGPGVRDIYALHYIISGQGYYEIGQQKFHLHAGESFIILPHIPIYYYPEPQDPWEYVWIEFKGSEVPQLLALTTLKPEYPITKAAPQRMDSFYDVSSYSELKAYEKIRSDAKIRLLISYYIEFYPAEATLDDTDYVRLSREYIELHYWKPSLTVTTVVEHVNIERSYLFRLFKKATSMSVLSYVTMVRIQRASELLKDAGLPIKSVAYSVGYSDPLYFSKVFKKATTYSPTEYKLLHQNK